MDTKFVINVNFYYIFRIYKYYFISKKELFYILNLHNNIGMINKIIETDIVYPICS